MVGRRAGAAAGGRTTVTGTADITNSGYTQLGANNADGLVGFKIAGTAGTETVSLVGGVMNTTATDTGGNVWNVALNRRGRWNRHDHAAERRPTRSRRPRRCRCRSS